MTKFKTVAYADGSVVASEMVQQPAWYLKQSKKFASFADAKMWIDSQKEMANGSA